MPGIARTTVGGVSLPRLICGTNWMLGYSHTTRAKDQFLRELFDTPSKIAGVLEVFARAGANAFMSMPTEFLGEARREAEQRAGVEIHWIATPSYADRGNPDTWKESVELTKRLGAEFCFPHTEVTDLLIDRANQSLDTRLTEHLRFVREMEMIPGLSTHAPEAIVFSDASGADVESYTQPYNAAGFLCQVETDWLQRIFAEAKKPVMVIKPLASGKLHPVTGLSFVWNTIRDCDMVTVGTMSTYEAEEVIEISLACLEGRAPNLELQFTRSKRTLVGES
jgi:hypothetical protein